MRRLKVLLALKDEAEARPFEAALTVAGFEAAAVSDGAMALESAVRDCPAIIVADLMLPVIDGRRFFNILKNNLQTARTPFFFLSDHGTTVPGLRTGFDALVVRPYDLEDIVARIKEASRRIRAQEGGSREIEGTLRQMPLTDLLQFLDMNKKEGELRVNAHGSSGLIYVKEGQIHNAILGRAEKEKALYRMLAWQDGRFEFVTAPVSAPRKMRGSTGALVMEGMRQIDEVERIKAALPGVKTIVSLAAQRAETPRGLSAASYEILRNLKGRQPVDDVVEQSAHTDMEAYEAVAALIKGGVLRAEAVSTGAPGEEPFSIDSSASIKEGLIRRLGGAHVYQAKVFVAAPEGYLYDLFTTACSSVPGFTAAPRPSSRRDEGETRLGEAGVLRLSSGFDIVFFCVPPAHNMGPLIRALSHDAVGLVMVIDASTVGKSKSLAAARREMLSIVDVPVAHVAADGPSSASPGDGYYKAALGLRESDAIFHLGAGEGSAAGAFAAIRALLGVARGSAPTRAGA